MKKEGRSLTIVDGALIIAFLALMAFIYSGFFSFHPVVLEGGGALKAVLLAIKVLFPLAALGIIALYLAVRTKKIDKASAIVLPLALVVLAVLLYPLADHFYRQRYRLDSSKYHTFLQTNPPLPSDFDPNMINIFCLGGSSTEFRDENGRDWPGMTQGLLHDRYGLDNVRIHNLGRAWYTTQHLLINYIQNLRKYRPRMLIVMENINDAWHNADFSRFSNGGFREDYGHYLGPEAFMIKFPSLFSILAESFKLLWNAGAVEGIDTDIFPGLAPYERNLGTIIELAKNDGTQVVLMTQPYLYKAAMDEQELSVLKMLNAEAIGRSKRWTHRTALSAMSQYNDKVRELAEKHGVRLIDLERIIPKTLDYFGDEVHYKAKAHDLIAEHLSQQLAALIHESPDRTEH